MVHSAAFLPHIILELLKGEKFGLILLNYTYSFQYVSLRDTVISSRRYVVCTGACLTAAQF
jgi:hypothetical protein